MFNPRYRAYSLKFSAVSSILPGIVIFALGLFLISPVAQWLLTLVGWLAIIAGAIVFAFGLWSYLRSRR